jgi:uncharacterized protein YkwD
MRMSGLTAIAAVVVLFGCAAPSGQRQPGGVEPAEVSNEVSNLINEKRAETGCPPVEPDERLATAARRHVTDMRDNDVKEHTGSDGSSPRDRIEAAGFTPAATTGEILLRGTGSTTARQAVDAWMASPPHREIIEECDFTHAGAVVLQQKDRYFAAVAFARPA